MNTLIDQILIVVALLSIGIVYGTDIFYAIVVRKAAALSNDSSVADLNGHTHLIADKRMPFIAVTAIVSSLLLTVINVNHISAFFYSVSLLALISHTIIYLRVAKPVNQQMSEAAVARQIPSNIRSLQLKWDSVINVRATLLTISMIAIICAVLNQPYGL